MGFHRTSDGVAIDLSDEERNVLRLVPDLLADVRSSDPEAARLQYTAHPDDEEAEDRYRSLIGDALDAARRDDRRVFAGTIDAEVMDIDEAEAWMRVVGEARLLLAGRLDINDDGWEDTVEPGPEVAVLTFLGYVQDALVGVLGSEL